MLSTGNDIVDLRFTNADRTVQSRFYSKILLPLEQKSAPGNLAFDRYVWLLWTVKESFYKYFKRLFPTLTFSPSKIIVSQINFPEQLADSSEIIHLQDGDVMPEDFITGQAESSLGSLFFRSVITEEFIAAMVAHHADFDGVHWGIKRIPNHDSDCQSAEVRSFALQRIKSLFPESDFQFGQKDVSGCSALLKDTEETDILVSFAHHERFVAYCFKL